MRQHDNPSKRYLQLARPALWSQQGQRRFPLHDRYFMDGNGSCDWVGGYSSVSIEHWNHVACMGASEGV